MSRVLSPVVFSANLADEGLPSCSVLYERRTASQLALKENWFQRAIAENPRLVIEPCTEAGLTDETWWCWGREVQTEVGPIDVLLVSESGRVGIVETKLAYNPEGRRKVVAQLLDYAAHLAGLAPSHLPALPASAGVSVQEVERRMDEGDFLLVVAGDSLDERAVKLSQAFLAQHMLSTWDLALVELTLLEAVRDAPAAARHVIVPHLRGVLAHEVRQVIRVKVDGAGRHSVSLGSVAVEPRATPQREVSPEPAAQTAGGASRAEASWSVPQFFQMLDSGTLPAEVKRFGHGLRALVQRRPTIQLEGGEGKYGTLLLKKNQATILKLCLDRFVKLTPRSFPAALGERAAAAYVDGLRKLYPELMATQSQPLIWHSRPDARLEELLALVDRVLEQSEKERPPGSR